MEARQPVGESRAVGRPLLEAVVVGVAPLQPADRKHPAATLPITSSPNLFEFMNDNELGDKNIHIDSPSVLN